MPLLASSTADDRHRRFRSARYLVVIDQDRLLPLLYGSIVIPPAAVRELTQTAAPRSVRTWMDRPPEWGTVRSPQKPFPEFLANLGSAEQEAIALAQELAADVLLADDEAARTEAEQRNIPVQGTLGVLDLAAEHGLLADLQGAIQKLQSTNFRASKKPIDFFLERDALRRKPEAGRRN